MTYISIVGGKIIKTTKGAHHMYAKENIVFNSNKTITEVGVENGIVYGEPKDAPKILGSQILKINGHFYNEDGTFEGKVDLKTNTGNVEDVYTCASKGKGNDKEGKEIETFNGIKLLKENDKNITHDDFCYIAYVVKMEAGDIDLKELKCIAYASFNYSKEKKQSWKIILAGKYSSVEDKKNLSESLEDEKSKLVRQSLFYALNGEDDLTKGATFWDGSDFLAWGNSEKNPWNKLGSNKFDEYKFIEIPKDVYDSYLLANGVSKKYPDFGKHNIKNDEGTHEHITKKKKKQILGTDRKPILDKDGKPTFEYVDIPSKIKYEIPAADFEDKNYWKSGSFYYETEVKETYGISATINAGKSIFWKKTKNRLTSETPIKK